MQHAGQGDDRTEPGAPVIRTGQSSPTDVTSAAQDKSKLQAKLNGLQQQIRRLRGEATSHVSQAANRLAELERELLDLSVTLADCEDGTVAERGHPALADAADWCQFTKNLGLADAVATAEELIGRLVSDESESWRESAAPLANSSDLQSLFDALTQTTTLELESLSHAPGEASGHAALSQVKTTLREALLGRVSEQEVPETTREAWASELVDRCDVALTSIDDLPPDRAAAQLALVSDEVAWHLGNVELERGRRRRRLRRRLRALRRERQERQLQARLEARFGRRDVALFERLILVLILFVIVLLVVEPFVREYIANWLIVADGIACVIFLWEFAVKLYLVSERGRWFLRRFLWDLIPSIPFGLIGVFIGAADLDALNKVRAGRLARFFRLPRLARYVRLLRPLIRLFRVFSFMTRGLDQLARRFGPLLNRNVILYPTREEREQAHQDDQSLTIRARRIRAELQGRWKHLMATAPVDQRSAVAVARLGVLEQARQEGLTRRPPAAQRAAATTREIPAETLLWRLGAIRPQEIEAELGEELTARIARMARLFGRPPVCWLPIIHAYAPRISSRMTDSEVVAAGARRAASALKRYHDRWFWLADLYGTITPSQFVDRLGAMLIKSSSRPAYRLVTFGGIFLLIWGIGNLVHQSVPEWLETYLMRYVGTTLLVIGGVCFLVLAAGMWLRRLAREATEFYERSAQAQFLPLTEAIRNRNLDRDVRILHRRVLEPEWRLHRQSVSCEEHGANFAQRVRQSLLGTHVGVGGHEGFDATERTVLLYRDSLDGAIMADSDTRTTSQLLGSPALRQFQALSSRIDRKEIKALQGLDLERQKTLLGGPYLWFNFISRAIAHGVARLIIEYNRTAIPLSELPLASEADRARYEAWLGGDGGSAQAMAESDEARYVTTGFTALHFLDDDAQRDQEVSQQFGERLLERLRRDRSCLIRRVFGSYPLHRLPKEERVLNLYTLYENWFARGRTLLLPWFLFLRGLKQLMLLTAWLARAVRELLRAGERADPVDAAQADFATAVRKIERMRDPVVYASIRLRTRMDPEYLGIPLPEKERSSLEGADLETDLEYLNPDPWTAEQLGAERDLAEADLKRLGRLIEAGLLKRVARRVGLQEQLLSTGEHVRAAAVVYLADFRGVRRHLSAYQILEEVYSAAALNDHLPPRLWPRLRLRRMFQRYWNQHGSHDRSDRRAAWRATVHNVWGAADSLRIWHAYGENASEQGERLLADLLRHPGRITQQLVTIRAIQTLAMIDILNYRQHVYRLGDYAAMGDRAGELLDWGTAEQEEEEEALEKQR